MKLIIAVINKEDKDLTEKKLTEKQYMLTEIGSTGGFLKQKNVSLMLCIPDESLDEVLDILKTTAGRRMTKAFYPASVALHGAVSEEYETEVGGCAVFIMDSARMEKF